jgi:Lipid A 3-O-deacylase (PagL)
MPNKSLLLVLFVATPLFALDLPSGAPRAGVTLMGGQSMKNWHGQATMEAISFEYGRAISPRTELLFAVAPMSVEQPKSWFGNLYGDGNERVAAISGSLIARRNFRVDARSFRPFVELGTGPMWAQKRVPASTSRFNFDSHLSVGATLAVHNGIAPFVGYSFQHVSNGGYAPRNPGLNFSSIVLGFRLLR